MPRFGEGYRAGLDAVDTMTVLLQRARRTHPTEGLFEAAELQWWWRVPRSTDDLPQLFWFDDLGRPVAAVIATDWGDGSSGVYEATTLVPLVMPGATPDWIAHVTERGLEHAEACGIHTVDIEVDRTDDATRGVLVGRGFAIKEDGVVVAWLDAAARPEISPLPEGYRLLTRVDTSERPHHFTRQTERHEEARLRETSLYRPELDLVVYDGDDDVAAYGLFWLDTETATGVVEPMRTHDDHQRRGLARHVLTAGVDRLAESGTERISIGYEPANPASGHLYRSVGFQPVQQTDVYAGPTNRAAAVTRRS